MPKFGTDYYQPRMDFFNPNIELISKNIKDTEAVHNNTMKDYADMNASILADDTLHPDERTKRLKRLEDKVFKDINSFSGNTAQASDTILNSIINERKDPFYNLDKQYTNVYNAAQANRAKLEAEGKSAFMRDAYGNEIDALPTLFDKDGNMRSQQDFQFDYEGILDYSKEAEEFVDDVVADIYRTAPTLVRGKDVYKLVGDFLRTGNVETTDQNLVNILNKSRKAFQQTASYDQMKRRGIEGSADAVLERAVEERKYTKEAKVDNLLSDVLGKQGGNKDLLSTYTSLRPIKKPIADTEEGTQKVNNIVKTINSAISGWWKSSGWGGQYSDDVVEMKNGKLSEKMIDVNGNNIPTPLTKSRALTVISKIDSELTSNTAAIKARQKELGINYINDDEQLNTLVKNNTNLEKIKGDLSGNLDKLGEFEKAQLSKYKTTADELMSSGLAADFQEALLQIESININEAIKDNTSYAISDEGGLKKQGVEQFAGLLLNDNNKFYALNKSDGESATEAADRLLGYNKNPEKRGQPINNKSTDIFSEGSNIEFDPELATMIVDGTYAMDPESFKSQYAVLAPALNVLTTIKKLSDLTNTGRSTTNKTLSEKGARAIPFIIDGQEFSLPTNSIIKQRLINGEDKAVFAIDVIDPKNPRKVQTFSKNDFSDAIKQAITAMVIETVIPDTEKGKLQPDLEKAAKVIPVY